MEKKQTKTKKRNEEKQKQINNKKSMKTKDRK